MNSKAEVSFYHLTTTPRLNALPKILEKILSQNKRAVVLFENEHVMEEVNDYLWSFSTNNVIPHGSSNDDFPEEQPIYLTTVPTHNPNNASILIITANTNIENLADYERYIYIFDGNIEDELQNARLLWKKYQNLGYPLIYWKQNAQGMWEKL